MGFHILFLLVFNLDVRCKFFLQAWRDKWRWRHTILTFHSTSGENRREKSARFRGCLHEKTRTGASFTLRWLLISCRVYMMTGSFHIFLFNRTFHVDKIQVWFKIANITHALPVPVYRRTDFTPKWVVVSRLHVTVARFLTGVKFSPRRENRGELTPGWLAPAQHFVVVSCKQIESHEREPEWTRSGVKVAPVSCKHHLSLCSYQCYARGGDHGIGWGLWTFVHTPPEEF